MHPCLSLSADFHHPAASLHVRLRVGTRFQPGQVTMSCYVRDTLQRTNRLVALGRYGERAGKQPAERRPHHKFSSMLKAHLDINEGNSGQHVIKSRLRQIPLPSIVHTFLVPRNRNYVEQHTLLHPRPLLLTESSAMLRHLNYSQKWQQRRRNTAPSIQMAFLPRCKTCDNGPSSPSKTPIRCHRHFRYVQHDEQSPRRQHGTGRVDDLPGRGQTSKARSGSSPLPRPTRLSA